MDLAFLVGTEVVNRHSKETARIVSVDDRGRLFTENAAGERKTFLFRAGNTYVTEHLQFAEGDVLRKLEDMIAEDRDAQKELKEKKEQEGASARAAFVFPVTGPHSGINDSRESTIVKDGVLKKIGREQRKLVVPQGVWKIGVGAGCWNSSLEEVCLPFTVSVITRYAFSHCTNLKTINFPEGLREIGKKAFGGCTSLEDVQLPKNVKLDRMVFADCTSLRCLILPEEYRIPHGVNGGDYAVIATGVTPDDVHFPKTSLRLAIGFLLAADMGIEYREDLCRLYRDILKRHTAGLAGYAVRYPEVLRYVLTQKPDVACWYPRAAKDPEVLRLMTANRMIPEEHIEKVIAMAERERCIDAVEEIIKYYDGNFGKKDHDTRFAALREVIRQQKTAGKEERRPEGPDFSFLVGEEAVSFKTQRKYEIRQIDGDVLSLVSADGTETTFKLWDINDQFVTKRLQFSREETQKKMERLADFMTSGGELRKYFGNQEHVTVPDGVTSIGDRAFSGKTEIKTICLPRGIREIGNEAFLGCTSLQSIDLPEGIMAIGDRAFAQCPALDSIRLPECLMVTDGLTETDAPVIALHLSLTDKDPDLRIRMIRGFIKASEDGTLLPEETRNRYLDYIRRQRRRLYPAAVRYPEILHLMLAQKVVLREHLPELLDLAETSGRKDLVAEILSYQVKNCAPVDPVKEFEKEFRKAQKIAENMAGRNGSPGQPS